MNVAGIPLVFDPDVPPGTVIIRQGKPRTLVGSHPFVADAYLFAAVKREAGYAVEVIDEGNGGGSVYVVASAG